MLKNKILKIQHLATNILSYNSYEILFETQLTVCIGLNQKVNTNISDPTQTSPSGECLRTSPIGAAVAEPTFKIR